MAQPHLTREQAARARTEMTNGTASIQQLADRMGVSYGVVSNAVRGLSFKDMADPPPVPATKPVAKRFTADEVRGIRQQCAEAAAVSAQQRAAVVKDLAQQFGTTPDRIRNVARRTYRDVGE